MRVYVNRGLPGSGKSTRTKRMAEEFVLEGRTVVICSSDDFFVCPSCHGYHWAGDKVRFAHMWCINKMETAMKAGVGIIIVDNVNGTVRECKTYVERAIQFGYEIRFLEPETPWAFDLDELVKKNVHGISRETLERMRARWVPDMTVEKALRLVQPGTMTADEQAADIARRASL